MQEMLIKKKPKLLFGSRYGILISRAYVIDPEIAGV